MKNGRMVCGTSACFEGNPSSMVVSRSCMTSSEVVSSLRRCHERGSFDSNAQHMEWARSSSSISSVLSSVLTESPAIKDRGIRGGGAETASGRDIPGGLCGPEGWRDNASDVQLRTPGMYTILKEYGRVFSFKLRNLALLMSARAIAKDADQRLVVHCNK